MKKVWSFVAIPATMLAVLTGSIGWVLLVRPFYYAQIGPLGLCAASGLTAEQVRAAYGDVMDYCLGLRPDFAAGVLPFSAEGASHFADVRVLFILNMAVLAVTVAFLLGLRIDCKRRSEALPRLGGRTPGFWAACHRPGDRAAAGGVLPQLRHRHRRFPAGLVPGAGADRAKAKKIERFLRRFTKKKYPRSRRGALIRDRTYRSLGCQSQSAKIMSSRSPRIQLFSIILSRSFLLLLTKAV